MPALSDFDPELAKRIISGAILALLMIAALIAGGLVLEIVIAAAIVLISHEWSKLANAETVSSRNLLWFGVLIPAASGVSMTYAHGPEPGFAVLLISMLCCIGILAALNVSLVNRAAVGAIYVGLPSLSIVAIRDFETVGTGLIIWMFMVIWTTDIAAYVSGRSFGGPRLAPAISPNKTWAGLIGGMVAAGLLGAALANLAIWPALGAALIASFLACTAQAGDLLESHLKRQAGVKDSGHIIPGHGGILDRVDGVMTAAPVMLALCLIAL